MPILGSLLTTLFVGIAEFFAKFITRRIAVIAAGIAVMGTLTTALYVGLAALVAGLSFVLPSYPGVMTGIWMFTPDNAPLCVSIALATDAAVAVYRLNVLNVLFSVQGG